MTLIQKSKEHIKSAGEGYFEHQRFAFRLGCGCIAAGLMAIIHSIIPALFESAASRKIKKIDRLIEERRTGKKS